MRYGVTSGTATRRSSMRAIRAMSGGRVPGPDLRPQHQAPAVGGKAFAAVDGAAIVPEHHVADAPFLVPGVLGLAGVLPQPVEQGLALGNRQAVNVGVAAAAQEQGLAAGNRVDAHERM